MWNTEAEKEFIQALGTRSTHCKNVSRADLLRGYIECTAARVTWDAIDSAVVRKFAEAELAAEQAALDAVKDMMSWQGLLHHDSVV